MAARIALLLLLLLPAAASGAGSTLLPSRAAPGGFQDCLRTLNVSVLGALPGGGWDNLRNVELGLVLQRPYARCLTTEDGEYLVPDDVRVVARRDNAVETRAELIGRWLDYTDACAASINADVSFLAALNGRFSQDCARVRKYEVEQQTVTARVQVRHSLYAVRAPPRAALALHPDFRRQLVTLSAYLERNRTREAQYLAELLVRHYGTHVLTDVEAGAALVQEDQVRRELLDNQRGDSSNVTLAASMLFYDTLGLGVGTSARVADVMLQGYSRAVVASRMRSRGGEPVAPGMTLQKWQQSLRRHLVPIGRAGLPLPDVLQPAAVPELPAASVQRVQTAVRAAIRRYYALNAHPGCVTRGHPGFNPQANVDDGSCPGSGSGGGASNFSFGGVFQECQEVSGPDAQRFCRAQRTPNPVTGNASCALGHQPMRLYRGLKTWRAPGRVCKQRCETCYLLFTCCRDECRTQQQINSARLDTFWCVPPQQDAPAPPAPGLLFGGLYSPGSHNPLTQAQACPDHFYPLDLLGELKVCVSGDLVLGAAQALPFGGFFSCQEGNPLAGLMKGQSPGFLQENFYQDRATNHPMKCPDGYSQHQGFVSEGCQILYCLRAGSLLEPQPAALRLPPFLPDPVLLPIEDTQGFPQMAKLSGHEGSEPSSWTIAATSLAVAVGLVVVSWGFWRCYRNRTWRGQQGYEGIGAEAEEEADPQSPGQA